MATSNPRTSAANVSRSKKHTGTTYLSRLIQEHETEEEVINDEDSFEGTTLQQMRDYAQIQGYNVDGIEDNNLESYIWSLEGERWRNEDFPAAPDVPTTSGRVSGSFDQSQTTTLHIWMQLFPVKLRELVLSQSNRYAAMKGGWKNGKELTMEELMAFFATILWLAESNPSQMSDFWTVDPFRCTGFVERPISRERFKDILANLHLAKEVRQKPHGDRAAKIRPMIDSLNQTFSELWVPASRITVEEDICPFKERRQMVPGKPNTSGLKIFRKLCDAEHFCYRLNIFQCNGAYPVPEPMGRGEAVVLDLLQGLMDDQQQPRHLFCDSAFTSVHLARFLKERAIYVTGTIRCDRRGLPNLWLKSIEKHQRGSSYSKTFDESSGLTLHVWNYIKQVVVLSSGFPTGSKIFSRWFDGADHDVHCPQAIFQFQSSYASVNRHNQSRSQIALHQKSYKWWHPLFYYLLECTVVNSWIIFKQLHPGAHISCRQFGIELYKQLLVLSKGPKLVTRRFQTHTLEGKQPKAKCEKCSARTPLHCLDCELHMHEKCFQEYHYLYSPFLSVSNLK